MIGQDMLDWLRCPLDPGKTRLRLEGDHLCCERCALRFKIKDDFPVMLIEDAELPTGCASMSQLPCQREEKKDTAGT